MKKRKRSIETERRKDTERDRKRERERTGYKCPLFWGQRMTSMGTALLSRVVML